MKKLSVLFTSVLFSAILFAINANAQKSEPFITRNLQASLIKEVEATTSGGSITISGDAGSVAVVEVYVTRDKWSDEKIKQTLEENYTIDIELKGGKLSVAAKPKNKINWNKQGLSISLKISVPKQVNSNLRTSGGSIHINDLSGSLDFKTSGGSLSIDNVSGKIMGKTSGGSINIKNSSNDIDLQTSGGSINTENCNGEINLKTSGGSIVMKNISGNIEAKTSGGSVNANSIKGSLKAGTTGGSVVLNGISGNVDAKTTGGSVSVTMETVGDYVKLSNTGNVNLTLPAEKGYNINVKANNIVTSELKDFRGNIESNRSIEGTMGKGGAEINIKGTKVNLSFK